MTSVAERIYNLRKAKKMAQDDFADFCGLSRSSIARYEAGKPINRVAAQKISDACNVPLSYLLDEKKEPDPFAGGFSEDELEIISMYRVVSQEGQDATKALLRSLSGKSEKAGVALG